MSVSGSVRAEEPRHSPSSASPHDTVSPLVEVAFLDRDGVIEWVNSAWDDFCRQNGGDPRRAGVGVSYLAACDAAGDDPGAAAVAAAIRTALGGELAAPVTVRIPCDSPTESRWFDVLISPRDDIEGNPVGASVSLAAAAAPRRAPTAARPGARNSELTFPDVPRLELEQLIEQMTERAQDVLRAQGRLRALIKANAIVIGDLNLRVALRHIAEAARELGEARYAALGVVSDDGSLEEFVPVGMDEATETKIGRLPRGLGLLGHLIRHPEPLRLADISRHPSAVGFPPGHPLMTSFLGVPIRIQESVVGILFLAGSHRGEFTAEDEQLVTSLAASAAVAIRNARLYEESERRRRWQQISTETAQLLFSDAIDRRPIEIVLDQAMRAADGDAAELALIGDDERVIVDAAVGDPIQEDGPPPHLDVSAAAPVLREGKPVLVEDSVALTDPVASRWSRLGSVLIVPITTTSGAQGALSVARRAGRPRFRRADLDDLTEFARDAGVALELRRARADREGMALIGEHDRIAADLHDHVIQELFSTGMGLQAMVHDLGRPDQQARILGFVEDLDATIRRIRTTIFRLDRHRESSTSLQQDLLAIVEQERAALGFSVNVDFSGPLDVIVPLRLHEDVCAVVRESLSNVARHARATAAWLKVTAGRDVITIDVVDNGVGSDDDEYGRGLRDLRERARAHRGDLLIRPGDEGGTQLTWNARTD